MRRIVSVTPYYNEKHILELRLGILEDVVDRFYTIEATKTHTGLDKPMTAQSLEHAHHSVVEIDFPEGLDNWGRENYQRDIAPYVVDLSDYSDDDIVLVTDLDEIPSTQSLELLRELFDPEYSYAFDMKIYQYYLNNQNIGEGSWTKAKACSVGYFKSQGFNATRLRLYENSLLVSNGGWHWTYIGNTQEINKKIEAFAHSEWDNAHTKSQLEQRREDNVDALGRPFELRTVELDETFPQYLRQNRDRYQNYIKEF